MSDIPILYSFRRCPYAMRARMALAVSERPYSHREVVLRAKPPSMLAASPKGTVPVLVLPGGTVIDESLGIMRWALAQYDPEDWSARADPALVAEFDDVFKHHLDRYKYSGRYDADPLAHRAAGLSMLATLDERLAQHDYLVGPTRGLSDIALFPFVRQFAGVDADWFALHAPHRVRDWLGNLVESELFGRIMVRFAPWAETEVS